jgi:hypothetical protein
MHVTAFLLAQPCGFGMQHATLRMKMPGYMVHGEIYLRVVYAELSWIDGCISLVSACSLCTETLITSPGNLRSSEIPLFSSISPARAQFRHTKVVDTTT